MSGQSGDELEVVTVTEGRHGLTQAEYLMNAPKSEREFLARQGAIAISDCVKSKLRQHESTAAAAFSLAATRLRDAQQSLEATYEEKKCKVKAYESLATLSPTNVQPTILNTLLLLFTALPDRATNDHALTSLSDVDWRASDPVSCFSVYRALTEHVSVSELSAEAALAVVETQLLLAIRSGSLRLLADVLVSPSARNVRFPKGVSLSRIAACDKAPKLSLHVKDLALRVGPTLLSCSRQQSIYCFPLDTSIALVAKSRLLLLDSSAATPTLYSLKGQASFPRLHPAERPIHMNSQFTLTVQCKSRSLYEQQFSLRLYRQRKTNADAVVCVTVNSRTALVTSPTCRFTHNGKTLSCLLLPTNGNRRSPLYVLSAPLSVDDLPAESQLVLDGDAVVPQRLSAACAPTACTPYLSLSFTKGYTLHIGEVTILDHFQPFCVEFWVFLRHVEEPQTIVAIGDKSADEVIVEVDPGSSGVVWKGGSRSTFLGASFARYSVPDTLSVVDRWTHVALNFTGTTWELCVDFRTVASGEALVRPDAIVSAPCRLGGNLCGFLAEVRVWNCHRSPLELQRDAHRGLVGDEAWLCGYYPINECGGDVVADYSRKSAHALLAAGAQAQLPGYLWCVVPSPPISSFVAAAAGSTGPEPRRIADVLPLAVAESSEDVVFTTTACSYLVTCHRGDTIHVYQYDMVTALLVLEHAITVPKKWALLDARANVSRNTLMCCAAEVGPRTSLLFWELQCQGPALPGALVHASGGEDRATSRTAWDVGGDVLHHLAYYAERLVPLEMPPRYPVWQSTMASNAVATGATVLPWPELLVDRCGSEVIPLLFRLAVVAAEAVDSDAANNSDRLCPSSGSTRTPPADMARYVCSVLSVNLLLYHESESNSVGHRDRCDRAFFTPFSTVDEMLGVMASADRPTMPAPARASLTTHLRDNLVRLALQPFARDTSLLQACCRCFLTAEGTLAFVKKLSGKPRCAHEETVMGCLIDSFASLPATQDILTRGTDGQVLFDALILDTLAAAQAENVDEPPPSFTKGIQCLTVLMEVLLARCAATAAETASAKTAATTAASQAAPLGAAKSPQSVASLGEHCCKSLLKASRHSMEWATRRAREQPDTISLVVRQLRRCHVGALLPWLLLTLPSMPTDISRTCLPVVRGCREALCSFTESIPHHEVKKARWLSELRLVLLHCQGLTTSLLTVDGLPPLPVPTLVTPRAGSEDSPSEPELALNPLKLMPLLVGGLRKAGTERDLLIKNLEHGVGPISKVVEELQRSDISALRIMRDEGTRKMELQIMAAFCALCFSTVDLANATKSTLQPAYRHVVALRPWILAKRQQAKGFTQDVASRARFLAMFEPCCTDVPVPVSLVTTGDAQRTVNATKHGGAEHANTVESMRRRWRKLFQTWRTARLVVTMQTSRPDGDSAQRFSDIKDVLRSSATLEQLDRIVSARVHLAHQRLRGLLALRALVEEARTDSLVATTLLPLIAQHMCQWHYARDVECCSTEDRFRLQEAFFQLLDTVVEGFNEAHNDARKGDTGGASSTTRRESWVALFVSLLTCDLRMEDIRRLRGAAFTAALDTLCLRVVATCCTPAAEEAMSVAAFSRPTTISLGRSGAPLLVSTQGGHGTAVGPHSCTTAEQKSASPSSSPRRAYFEVHLVDVNSLAGTCAIGMGPADYSVSSFPGLDHGSRALRLTDGVLFTGSKASAKPTGAVFSIGDVAGCGVDTEGKTVYWTRNGTVIATLPVEDADAEAPVWHPLIGLEGCVTVMVNLGDYPFVASSSPIEKAKHGPQERQPQRNEGHGFIAEDPHWDAFRTFSLRCALAVAQRSVSGGGDGHVTASPHSGPSSPPPPTSGSSPPSDPANDQLVHVMGLCFRQIVRVIEFLRSSLSPLTSPAVATTCAHGEPPRSAVPHSRTSSNAITVLQHTQTLALLLAEIDPLSVVALARHLQPLVGVLHGMVNDLLSRSHVNGGKDDQRPFSCLRASGSSSCPHVDGVRLLNAAMLTYYFVSHLTPPPPQRVPTAEDDSITHNATAAPPPPASGRYRFSGTGSGMLTVLLQLAGRVCVASRGPGDLGAPPTPRRRAFSRQGQTVSPHSASGAPTTPAPADGGSGESGVVSAVRDGVNEIATEAAEQAVWMAVALLQRMVGGTTDHDRPHSWQRVLRSWLLACLDRPQTSGRDVLLALTVLQSGPRLAVPGDVVSVRRSAHHETRDVLQWLSLQDGVCQVLDDDGRQCYLPLRLVNVAMLDDGHMKFPRPGCTEHAELAEHVLTLCVRLGPTMADVAAVSVEQQAIFTSTLSLVSRCVARQVVAVPPSVVRVVLSLASAVNGDDDSSAARRDVDQLRLQKVITESWCGALLQTNQMRRRSTSGTSSALNAPSPIPPSGTSPSSSTHPSRSTPLVTSSTTQIYRTAGTTPYAPPALSAPTAGGGGSPRGHLAREPHQRSLWTTDTPMRRGRSTPFREPRYPPRGGEIDTNSSTDDDEGSLAESEEGEDDLGDDDEEEEAYLVGGELVMSGSRAGQERPGRAGAFDHLGRERQLQAESFFESAGFVQRSVTTLSSADHDDDDDYDERDEFFFLDEYEPFSFDQSSYTIARAGDLSFFASQRNTDAQMELLQEQWLSGHGHSAPQHALHDVPRATPEAGVEETVAPTRISTGIHFDHSCLRLFASRDIGQYYTIDLYLNVHHLRGHQIIFVQQTSITQVPSAEMIARLNRGTVEFGLIESLPGQEVAASVTDVCRYALRPEDAGRWVRLTFAQTGTVVSIFRDGVLRNSHRMRPHVSSLLQEEFFLGGVPEDPDSSLDGSVRDFCIYDVALRPTMIDQRLRRASPLSVLVDSHLAVRLQVHGATFVNAAPSPAAVLLDIATDGQVGNLEQRCDVGDSALTAPSPGTADDACPTNVPVAPPPVEEVDFGSESEWADSYRVHGTSSLADAVAWRHRRGNRLDRLTANYSACLRQLMHHYSTRLAMLLLTDAVNTRRMQGKGRTPRAALLSAPSTTVTDDALAALAAMSNMPDVVQALVLRITQSTDTELHSLLAGAAERLFELAARGSTPALSGCGDDDGAASSLDCVASAVARSLLEAASLPEKRASFESAHPVRSVISTHLELLPGETEKETEDFHVYFDPRCASSQGTYTFAADPAMSEVLYATRSFAVTDFCVSLPRLYLDIRADVNSAPQWGFKLAVVWQSESQLHAMRLLRKHARTSASSATECFRLLELCTRVNSGKSRRLALACLTELLVLSPPSPFPTDLLSSLHVLHLMAERLCRTGKSSSRTVHRTRFSQLTMECYLFYRDVSLCLAKGDERAVTTATDTTPQSPSATRADASAREWKALTPEEELDVYQKQRQQRRLLYDARKEERVDLVTLDVSRSVSLEWTAHHTCLVRSEHGMNSLVTNIALSTGCWYYEVKMTGTGSVFLGVYAVPPTLDGARKRAQPRWYALNGYTGVLQIPGENGVSVEESVVSRARLWGSKDTVGVIVNINERLCRFLVNGADSGVSFSFAANTDEAVTAAAAELGINSGPTSGDGSGEEDAATFRIYFALDHGEMACVNFGGSPFDFGTPRHCLPVDPAYLGDESTLPYHQMRAFQDVALHLLEPDSAYVMPPFYDDVSEPFADCPERHGPAHVTLHAPEAVQIHGLDAKNTGSAFHTVHADCSVRGGRWYYEVAVRTQGLMQVGWAIQQARAPVLPTGEGGCGVGDTAESWSVDGFRLLKWHAGQSEALTTSRRWSVGDVVGCALDLVRGTMLFTINGRPLVGYTTVADTTLHLSPPQSSLVPATFTFEKLPLGAPYVPCLSMRAGNAVLFNFGSSAFRHKPDGFSALGVPDTWIERIETFYANERLASIHRRLEAIRRFCLSADSEPSQPSGLARYTPLTQFIDELCASTGKNYRQITEKTLKDAVEEHNAATAGPNRPAQQGGGLSGLLFTADEAWAAMEKLLALTRILKSVFPFLAFGTGGANITTRLFLALRPVLFRTWRAGMAEAMLRESNVRSEYVRLSVNRVMARSAAAVRGGPKAFPRTLFGQTFLSVVGQHPRLFCTNKRLWRTVFIGEGAEDVGGPYREHLTDMCAELMSTRLPFFVPTPNHSQNLGSHRDAFVPAAGAVSKLDLDAFAFIGRLMGSAVRSGEPLSLSLAPPVWKCLCDMPLCESDLQTVDLTCWQCVQEFRALASQDASAQEAIDDALDSVFFVTQLCDGTVRELIDGGATVPVTAPRLLEYSQALLATRLHEFDRQVAKMREGMLAVVPEAVLVLFTPAELEVRVCGQPDVSVEELRRGVVYEGLTSEDRRVGFLWQALEEATPKQRRLFLRFASGRDRLPVKLRVVALPTTGDPDHSLVKAATCFFAVEIPDYSSLDVMKRKLYYSVENCVDMDTDFVARPTDGEERPQFFTSVDTDRLDEFGTSLSESNLSAP